MFSDHQKAVPFYCASKISITFNSTSYSILSSENLYAEVSSFKSMETSVTRLGDFLKFLVSFFTKVAQIFGDFLSHFEEGHV